MSEKCMSFSAANSQVPKTQSFFIQSLNDTALPPPLDVVKIEMSIRGILDQRTQKYSNLSNLPVLPRKRG